MNHLLRCPQDFSDWAAGLLQPLPTSDDLMNDKLSIDHFLTMLYLLFLPIRYSLLNYVQIYMYIIFWWICRNLIFFRRREQYLSDFNRQCHENSWTIVDSDEVHI